ncbi:MAG: biopolymer transporter ExbD [Bdellovibrionales bacterium]|nr:biopolymer transporter ExbD [Bdellovibrionales bacterium]
MSHVDTSSSGKPGRASGDFDLNIAPIIDCFVVLIAFLLISASYVAIGMIDAGVQAGQAAPTSANPPPVQVVVELMQNQNVRVKITGAVKEAVEIPASNNSWDYERLQTKLGDIKQRWPAVDGATLSAAPDVEYRDVVKGMEVVRKKIPMVLLGEF